MLWLPRGVERYHPGFGCRRDRFVSRALGRSRGDCRSSMCHALHAIQPLFDVWCLSSAITVLIACLTVRIVTLDEYARLDRRASVYWLIYKLLPRPGIVLLEAPPKAGKTRLALDVALAVAQGRDWAGQRVEQGRVLYLYLESESDWREMIENFQESGVDLSGPLYLVHPDDRLRPLNVLHTLGMAWLRQLIQDVDPVLTVIDVFRELHTVDEDSSTEMKRVGDALDALFVGRTVLLLHHTHKLREDAPVDVVNASRGSSYIAGKAGAVWLLHGTQLRIVSRYDEPRRIKLAWGDAGLWTFPEAMEYRERRDAALALCTEFPEQSHSVIAETAKARFGWSRATYYRLLSGRRCAHSSSSKSPTAIS